MDSPLSLLRPIILVPLLASMAIACEGDGDSAPANGPDAGDPDAAALALEPGDIDPTVGTDGWFDFERGVDVLVPHPQGDALVLANSTMAILDREGPMEVIEADHPYSALAAFVDPTDGGVLFQTSSGYSRYDGAFNALPALDTSIFTYTRDASYLDDGRLLLFGTINDALAVVRYLKNGEIDMSFGDAGVATVSAEFELRAEAMAVGADGSIWLGCSSGFTPCASKLSANGSTASELVVLSMGPRNLRDIIATDDGGAVVLGMIFDNLQLAKLGSEGGLDRTLGEDGIVEHGISLPFEEGFEARELVADGSGGFYLHGTYSIRESGALYPSQSETWLFHVSSALAVDGHFAGSDKVVIDYNRDDDDSLPLSVTKGLVVAGDHLLAGGYAQSSGGVITTIGGVVALRR